MKYLILLLCMLASPAFAQTVLGTLQAQNKLSEIAAGGPDYQAQARANLGLGSSIGYPTGTSGATIPLNNGGFTQSGPTNFSGPFTVTGNATIGGTLFLPGSAGISNIDPGASTLQLNSGSTGANGNIIARANLRTENGIAMQPVNPISFSGSQFGGPSVNPMYESEVVTGSSSSGSVNFNTLQITNDMVNLTNPNTGVAYGWEFLDQATGAATGGRSVIAAVFNQTAQTHGLAAMEAMQGYATCAFNNGGTDTGVNSQGGCAGGNFVAELGPSATNYFQLTGLALNIGAQYGSSVGIKAILNLVNGTGDAVRATSPGSLPAINAFLRISTAGNLFGAAHPNVGMDGIIFDQAGQQWPLDPQDHLIVALQANPESGGNPVQNKPPLATAGVDFSIVNFSQQSGDALHMPGFTVDGVGQVSIANAFIGTTSSGMKIDIPAQIATAASVATGGAPAIVPGISSFNYWPGDVLYGPSGGQYLVVTTGVLSAAVGVSGGGSGGTNGTQTVTGTTGTGTPFQASVTVAGGAITSVNSISVAGSYTANPSNIDVEPVTGAGLTGAFLTIGVGVNTVTLLVPDAVAGGASTYPNPVATSGGSGRGATLTLTWAANNTLALNPSGGAVTIGAGGLTIASLPTGTPATYACFTSGGALISSASPC